MHRRRAGILLATGTPYFPHAWQTGLFTGILRLITATTLRLSLGTYQIAFKGPCGIIQIKNGWFRVIEPGTLTFGTLPARGCTVADCNGVPDAL
jgi:hypothetical protein